MSRVESRARLFRSQNLLMIAEYSILPSKRKRKMCKYHKKNSEVCNIFYWFCARKIQKRCITTFDDIFRMCSTISNWLSTFIIQIMCWFRFCEKEREKKREKNKKIDMTEIDWHSIQTRKNSNRRVRKKTTTENLLGIKQNIKY